jgi:ADP-ribose diphosphatase
VREHLPKPPKLDLEVIADRTGEPNGFLTVRRFDLVTLAPSGTRSAVFRYDVLDRRALDACVMVAHHLVDGRPHVWLRSAIRPPVYLRDQPPAHREALWEVPAGLVEPGESPAAAAAREVVEELGFEVTEAEMTALGPWAVPAPGFVGEMHHFFHVRVDPKTRTEPAGDGSPLEAGAAIVPVPLEDALAACRAGEIRDAKTELALRRFAEVVAV